MKLDTLSGPISINARSHYGKFAEAYSRYVGRCSISDLQWAYNQCGKPMQKEYPSMSAADIGKLVGRLISSNTDIFYLLNDEED